MSSRMRLWLLKILDQIEGKLRIFLAEFEELILPRTKIVKAERNDLMVKEIAFSQILTYIGTALCTSSRRALSLHLKGRNRTPFEMARQCTK